MKNFAATNKSGINKSVNMNVLKLKTVMLDFLGVLLIVGVNLKKQLH